MRDRDDVLVGTNQRASDGMTSWGVKVQGRGGCPVPAQSENTKRRKKHKAFIGMKKKKPRYKRRRELTVHGQRPSLF